jgi:hypothetical protein
MKSIFWLMLSVCMLIRCCGLTAAFAGPREAVAVAMAVDELLQSNTPDLPDELSDDQREARPMPPPSPAGVCPCGCGKVNCTCPHAMGVVGAKPCPPMTVAESVRQRAERRQEESGPVIMLDVKAIDAITTLVPPLEAYDPAWCGVCKQNRATLKAQGVEFGTPDCPIVWKGAEYPSRSWQPAGYPMFYDPMTGKHIYGRKTMDELRAFAQLRPPVAFAVGATNVGTIKGRDALAKLFAQVMQSRGESVIQFGPASVTIPDGMTCDVTFTPQILRVKFSGKKPAVRVGTGWLSLGRPVAGLSIAQDRVAISIDGFPDLSLTVE